MDENFPFEHFMKNKKDQPQPSQISIKELKLFDKKTSPIATITSASDASNENTGFDSAELEMMTESILAALLPKVSPEKFNAYFKTNFRISNVSMDNVYFQVKTIFIKDMIQRQFSNEITSALYDTLGKHYDVIIQIQASDTTVSQASKPQPSEALRPKSPSEAMFSLNLHQTEEDKKSKVESQFIDHMDNTKNVLIDPSKTFDNFIIGPSNNLAYAAALAVAKNPGLTYKSLYIHSNSGLGKTHLLHAVANGIRELHPQYAIGLITAHEFLKEMIRSIRDKKRQEFQAKYSEKYDVLMIDDIHELSHKEGTQDELFHIFNRLHDKGKQLIFTSDKAPDKIEGIEERIRTRLQWGLVVDIQKPDLETRIALLKRKTFELDLYLQDDIVNIISVSIKSNIRELEGAAIKLKAYSDIMNVEIDKQSAMEILNLGTADDAKVITLEDIAKATASYYRVYLTDLKSKARQKAIVNARFVAMYLSRKIVNATQNEIGKFYSRDHSSVVHAEKEMTKRLAKDPALSKDITTIEANL